MPIGLAIQVQGCLESHIKEQESFLLQKELCGQDTSETVKKIEDLKVKLRATQSRIDYFVLYDIDYDIDF